MEADAPRPFGFVDDALAPYAAALGDDHRGYRNHVQRVLHHFVAFTGGSRTLPMAVQVAAPLHDLGIWTASTFDYLEPSVALAAQRLQVLGREDLLDEVALLIREHHRIRRHAGPHASTVEAWRRADWTDVTRGWRRFGLPRAHLQAVGRAFPDAGFHARLAQLTLREALHAPLRPLPMLRW